MDIEEILDQYGCSKSINWAAIPLALHPKIMAFFDVIHDEVVSRLDTEGRDARIIAATKLFPKLRHDTIVALVAAIEFDYR